LRAYVDHGVSVGEWRAQWLNVEPTTASIAALESAIAETTKERERADVLQGFLRGTTKVCEDAQADAERMRSEVERLRAELAARQPSAQEGPSDKEIRDAIERVFMCGYTATSSALSLIARRAGVKL